MSDEEYEDAQEPDPQDIGHLYEETSNLFYNRVLTKFFTDVLTDDEYQIIMLYIFNCSREIFYEYINYLKINGPISNDRIIEISIACIVLAFKTITAFDWGITFSYENIRKATKNINYSNILEIERDLMKVTNYKSCAKLLRTRNEDDSFLHQDIPIHLRSPRQLWFGKLGKRRGKKSKKK